VLFTNIPGGIIYHIFDETLRALGHRVAGVVTTPGPRQRRNQDYLDVVAAVRPGVDVIVTSHPNRLAGMLAPLKPDLIISAGFSWLIPAEVVDLPRLGAINLHPSLLPRHRGPNPIEWAFRNGDAETGFTIHELGAGFDTGGILAQHIVPIDDEDDHDSLLERLVELLPGVIEDSLARIALGQPTKPQDETKATYAGSFDDDWRAIDWSRPAREIHNQVRSWTGFRGVAHGAIGMVDGAPLTITKTRLLPASPNRPAVPGTVLQSGAERLVVQCGDGPLEIVAWSRDGKAGEANADGDARFAMHHASSDSRSRPGVS
jgi:methionyl-tRNA formyltransferase